MGSLNGHETEKRKNMSWRKPVPRFIPSRPTSFMPTFATPAPLGDADAQAEQPPLPKDWREAIERAHDWSRGELFQMTHSPEAISGERTTHQIQPVKVSLEDVQAVAEPGKATPARSASLPSVAATHQRHQPPTPSAAASTKLPRIDQLSKRDRDSFGSSQNIIYPDLLGPRIQNSDQFPTPVFPVFFDRAANMSPTAMTSRDDLHSQITQDALATPKAVCFPMEIATTGRDRPHQSCTVRSAWTRLRAWGGAIRTKLVRLFGLARTPGAVTYC